MRFTARVPAAEHEKFAPWSWGAQVGHAAQLTCFGVKVGHATIVRADVAADGSGVELTFDAELEPAS